MLAHGSRSDIILSDVANQCKSTDSIFVIEQLGIFVQESKMKTLILLSTSLCNINRFKGLVSLWNSVSLLLSQIPLAPFHSWKSFLGKFLITDYNLCCCKCWIRTRCNLSLKQIQVHLCSWIGLEIYSLTLILYSLPLISYSFSLISFSILSFLIRSCLCLEF